MLNHNQSNNIHIFIHPNKNGCTTNHKSSSPFISFFFLSPPFTSLHVLKVSLSDSFIQITKLPKSLRHHLYRVIVTELAILFLCFIKTGDMPHWYGFQVLYSIISIRQKLLNKDSNMITKYIIALMSFDIINLRSYTYFCTFQFSFC